MKNIVEKIQKSEYIYSIYTKWELKRYRYNVCWWDTEDLPDEFYVVCGILDAMGGSMDKINIGELLGFAMRDISRASTVLVYRDKSEVRLFEGILSMLEKERLIKKIKDDIHLTPLGKISFSEKRLFRFHKGSIDTFQHVRLNAPGNLSESYFPFKSDMGIPAILVHKNQYWPEEQQVEGYIYGQPDNILQYLSNQIDSSIHLYQYELMEYFEWDFRNVNIDLYQNKTGYIPAVKNTIGDVAPIATGYLLDECNNQEKERLVLECLFRKLWDDKDAIFTYDVLSPFRHLVDYEALTIDPRVQWHDDRLFNLITENASADSWGNISNNCDVDVIKNKLDLFEVNWDWDVLSKRIDDEFLITNFLRYPWSIEAISKDRNRSISTIQALILQRKESDEQWVWSEFESRLDPAFIWDNLDIVDVDLRKFTENTDKCRQTILRYPDRLWDWEVIVKSFELDYIVSALKDFYKYIKYDVLFDRLFSTEGAADKYLNNSDFRQTINRCEEEGILSYLNLNQKEYYWSIANVRFLMDASLLSWETTPRMMGFECNPCIVWDKPFFDAFSSYVKSADGFNSVSSSIEDVSLLAEHPDFPWDWDAISCNSYLINTKELYKHFCGKLNWTILLRSIDNAAIIEQIENLDTYLADNEAAWTSFSEIVSVPSYIQAHRDYPWDWMVLTERMFPNLKLSGLCHPAYINKWNWTYLTEHLNETFISENLKRLCDYWDWDVLCKRLLSQKGLKLNIDYIDTFIPSINAILLEDKRNEAWHAFTSSYTFDELKSLMIKTKGKSAYAWDMGYFCAQPDFRIPDDLNECADCIDWNIISSSPYVEKQLAYEKNRGLTQRAWSDQVREILSTPEYHWNYRLLSHFSCLNDKTWFLTKYENEIDWDFVCANSTIFAIRDKQKFNEILQKYRRHVNVQTLANRKDVDTAQLMKLFPDDEYDYNMLMKSGKWFAEEADVERLSNYSWDWELLCQCPTFKPGEKFLLKHLDDQLDWASLSRKELSAWNSVQLIQALSEKSNLRQVIDWKLLSAYNKFPLNTAILRNLRNEQLDWNKLSGRKELKILFDLCKDKVNWRIISKCDWFARSDQKEESVESLRLYKSYVDWSIITDRCWQMMDSEFLNEFENEVDWNILSQKNIPFTKVLIDRFKEHWNWAALCRNRAYYNNDELFGREPRSKENIIKFLNRFTFTPRAYHFAHMSNAVQIIREMKLYSRNAAAGKFEDSAGSNVTRTNKAHRFARFYFKPQSPTQFHNECLGRDSTMSYYSKYISLGYPRCPLPVFFVVDIEELLSVIPEKCYYSNGNMQADSTNYYKVIDYPLNLNVQGLTRSDNFKARQQEFLVDEVLDISHLDSLRICCYDDIQKELLCEAIKDSPLVDKVEVDKSLYIRQNRELTYSIDDQHVEITTDLKDEYYYNLIYEKEVPDILNQSDIVSERGNEIRFHNSVNVGVNHPFRIYFESHNKKWLIYHNDYGKH